MRSKSVLTKLQGKQIADVCIVRDDDNLYDTIRITMTDGTGLEIHSNEDSDGGKTVFKLTGTSCSNGAFKYSDTIFMSLHTQRWINDDYFE